VVVDAQMTLPAELDRARVAFENHAWTQAYEGFRAAELEDPLDLADLERLAIAAQLLGHDDEAIEVFGRAHQQAIGGGDRVGAARHAFRLGMILANRGDMAVAGGWLGRATRLVEESGVDCVERGYVLVPQGIGQLDGGDPAGSFATFEGIAEIAQRFGDVDLGTMSRLGRGRALIDMTEVPRGVALLDDAMLAVTAGEVSPVIAGIVYCASIEAFQAIFDLRRAQEWTDALRAWCDAQPDLVPFRGRCLVYRAELMQLHGAWPEAIDEARRAQEWLSRPPPEPAVGEAFYQQAELHRLRGEHAEAEAAYREASQWGRRPEPGLALLRLAQGRLKAASVAIGRAVDEALDEVARARLLEPQVEIALALGDQATAREAADRLTAIAALVDAPFLTAIAGRANGAVLLAEGDARAALGALRSTSVTWQHLDAPYEAARVRAWIGVALQQLGDVDSAELEFEAARRVFRDLGATPELARLDAMSGAATTGPGGLSVREVEVLRMLAAGKTNRTIAAELGISERTVDRHVSNIFTKLDVSSRSAATAYAYEHGLR
jgi:DNA-binding CsgD family transcriptional regulator